MHNRTLWQPVEIVVEHQQLIEASYVCLSRFLVDGNYRHYNAAWESQSGNIVAQVKISVPFRPLT